MRRSQSLAFAGCVTVMLAWLAGASHAAPTVLVPRGGTWKWFGGAATPSPAWRDSSYDDSGWSGGPAPLGYGESRIETPIPFGGVPNARWITTYFRVHFPFDADPASIRAATLEADYDDGFVATLNGIEIARRELPTGTIAWATPANNHESGNFENIALAAPSGLLVPGDNVLAIELHQRNGASSDLLWDGALSVDTSRVDVSRGPYLQLTTSDAATVRWRTPVPTIGRVWFGIDPGSFSSYTDEAAPTTDHEVRLTQLAPETEYFYRVGATDEAALAPDATQSVRTAPAPGAARPVRLWAIGDSGLGNLEGRRVRDAYQTWAGTHREDVVLMLGDNAYPVGTDANYQAGLFDQYPSILKRTAAWPTRGNHDLLYAGISNDYYDLFSLPSAGEAGGVPSDTEAWYSFDWGPVHLVCLDSEGSDRSPASSQFQWLRSDLAATTQPWVIAYWHHPPYTKGSHDSDDVGDSGGRMRDMRENAIPLLDSLGVDLVLSGHSHSYERSYLLDGHYGTSGTLTPVMKLGAGDGRVDGDGAYLKPTFGSAPHEGTVYTVNGSAAQASGGTLDHVAMVSSLNVMGSMVIDVDGARLDARFLDELGVVRDSFAIVKTPVVGVPPPVRPTGIQFSAPRPTPFTSRVVLPFALDRPLDVTLSILDLSGRRVRTFSRTQWGRGEHRVTWDGRDDGGHPVPPGAYFALLESAGTRRVQRLTRLR
ncbi:MAG: hypothetical protein HOP12_09485 [Candidatus Eisenbacteria bacterium]|uniref:Fibronectin type-III domain-containing protein n=1 Tax=Eiseniibacteriota bacterium TaxID=2212470 RepID=A0A849SF72_UNCEI|nr:hypothetical protein [Candidatus Eisenbacteria bacterium]